MTTKLLLIGSLVALSSTVPAAANYFLSANRNQSPTVKDSCGSKNAWDSEWVISWD